MSQPPAPLFLSLRAILMPTGHLTWPRGRKASTATSHHRYAFLPERHTGRQVKKPRWTSPPSAPPVVVVVGSEKKPASRTGQQRDRDRDRHPLTGPLRESSPGPLISSLLTKITIKTEEEASALAASRHVGTSSCQSSCYFEETSESSERDREAFTEQVRHFYLSKDSPVNIFFYFPSHIPFICLFFTYEEIKIMCIIWTSRSAVLWRDNET